MNKADIPFLSAAAVGELIHKKEISPVEAASAYLDRMAAVDGKLHSYITVCREEALNAARGAEGAIMRGDCCCRRMNSQPRRHSRVITSMT